MSRFIFRPASVADRPLIHIWLGLPHVAKWFYGQGLENTKQHLEAFFQGSSSSHYWLGFDGERPIAFLITSSIYKTDDELAHWCSEEGDAMTLDMLIGDTEYVGRGLAHLLIQNFLISTFPLVAEVLIDPEATNTRAIRVYQKAGFRTLGEFIPSHSPHSHLMMRLNMKELLLENKI